MDWRSKLALLLPGLAQVLYPLLIPWVVWEDLYLSFPLPIETLVLSSCPTLTWPQKWGSLDPQENEEGTLSRRDINEPGYGVALERQARVAERLGWGVTCSLSNSDGGAFSRGWGGGITGVGVDRVHSGGFSSISFF